VRLCLQCRTEEAAQRSAGYGQDSSGSDAGALSVRRKCCGSCAPRWGAVARHRHP
jgi:hypothetical protein